MVAHLCVLFNEFQFHDVPGLALCAPVYSLSVKSLTCRTTDPYSVWFLHQQSASSFLLMQL